MAWHAALDLAVALLTIVALIAGLSDGIRIHIGFIRLSMTSPARLLLIASAIAVARHLARPSPPIHRELARWFRSHVRDDSDVRAAQPASWRLIGALVALFTGMSIVMTWPLALHIRDGVSDTGDPLLNAWALKWVAHQIVADTRHLFDGNIFYPSPKTLAYSETLIAPALLAAPLSWLGAGALLLHNIVFLAGLIASGVGCTLLVRDLTGRIDAAIVSGIAFAFLPFRFDHFPQLQLQQAQWIPFALWALHRVIWRGRIADGVWLGVSVAGQLLSCMYYGVYLGFYLVVAGGCLLLWRMTHVRTWIASAAISVAVALALFAPAARAYVAAREVVGERSQQENVRFSATWTNYLAAPDGNRLYGWTADRFGDLDRNLFPGVAVVVLAVIALWPPISAVRLTYACGLALAVDVTLGFNGLLYPTLYRSVAPFRALRIPALAVVLVGFSLAVLAGLGIARLLARVRPTGSQRALVAGACGVILLESLSIPMQLTTLPTGAPAIYDDLLRDNAGRPTAVVAEVPMWYAQGAYYQDQIYMYYSTFHWQTLLNGYSGFFPPTYLELAALMRTFPDQRSLQALRQRNARYVVVHGERMAPAEYHGMLDGVDACRCGVSVVARRSYAGAEMALLRLE